MAKWADVYQVVTEKVLDDTFKNKAGHHVLPWCEPRFLRTMHFRICMHFHILAIHAENGGFREQDCKRCTFDRDMKRLIAEPFIWIVYHRISDKVILNLRTDSIVGYRANMWTWTTCCVSYFSLCLGWLGIRLIWRVYVMVFSLWVKIVSPPPITCVFLLIFLNGGILILIPSWQGHQTWLCVWRITVAPTRHCKTNKTRHFHSPPLSSKTLCCLVGYTIWLLSNIKLLYIAHNIG